MPFPHPSGNSRPSYWMETTPATGHLPIASDERVEVLVIGGGIVGVTAAYLVAKAGKSVIVVDRERIGMAETGHTTAHLQIVVDTRLADLIERFGIDGARRIWDSQLEAVRTIETICDEERIACDLQRLPAYLYGDRPSDKKLLREELRLAREIGYDAEEADPSDVPFSAKAAIRFLDQGKFHPRKYLLGLARRAQALGARFHEGSEIVEIEEGRPAKARTREGNIVTADWIVQATNTPFAASELIHTILYPYRTYALGLWVPRGVFGDALYWDTADPYHYTRVEHLGARDLVIFGGADHKVGVETDTEARYAALIEDFRQATDDFEVGYRWSGEILETQDDLPLIGHAPGRGENELVVTGDSGTGMTNGTIGAVMIAERILGRGTPWDEMYDPARFSAGAKPVKGWIQENAQVTGALVGRMLKRSEVDDLASIPPGRGAIVRRGLRQAAVSRDADGTLHACSARCTHMGCTVAWNDAEASWDCPCHGSRFSPTGEVLHGPAVEPLEPVDAAALREAKTHGRGA